MRSKCFRAVPTRYMTISMLLFFIAYYLRIADGSNTNSPPSNKESQPKDMQKSSKPWTILGAFMCIPFKLSVNGSGTCLALFSALLHSKEHSDYTDVPFNPTLRLKLLMVHIPYATLTSTAVKHRISLEILIITRIIFCDVEFCLECVTHAMRPMSIVFYRLF